jgi:hypothetical protein
VAIALRTGPFDVIRALPPGVWRTALLATAALLVYHPGPIPALRSWGFHFPIYLPGWGQVALWGFALIAAALPAGPQLLLKLARGNGLLLASPAGFLAGIVLLVQGFGSGRIIGGQRLLLAAAVLPALLGLVIMKMVLGAADWDIIAFVGLPLLLWTTAHAGRSGRLGRETMAFLVLLSLGNTWGFVLVNNGEASLTRIRDIVSTDPAPYYSSHPAGLHLASLFGANGLTR